MGLVTDFLLQRAPSYLQRPMGQAFLRTFGAAGDDFRDTCTFAFREAMIETATPDAYGAHLRNSGLIAVRQEPASRTLAALRGRWLTARQSGGVEGLVAVLARLGYPGCTVTTQLDLYLLGNHTAFGGYQGFFFVTVPQGVGFLQTQTWQDGSHWKDGKLWALVEPYPGALGDLLYVIQKVKPGCTSCRFVKFLLPAGRALIVPLRERWERLPDGTYPDLYNYGY